MFYAPFPHDPLLSFDIADDALISNVQFICARQKPTEQGTSLPDCIPRLNRLLAFLLERSGNDVRWKHVLRIEGTTLIPPVDATSSPILPALELSFPGPHWAFGMPGMVTSPGFWPAGQAPSHFASSVASVLCALDFDVTRTV